MRHDKRRGEEKGRGMMYGRRTEITAQTRWKKCLSEGKWIMKERWIEGGGRYRLCVCVLDDIRRALRGCGSVEATWSSRNVRNVGMVIRFVVSVATVTSLPQRGRGRIKTRRRWEEEMSVVLKLASPTFISANVSESQRQPECRHSEASTQFLWKLQLFKLFSQELSQVMYL